VSARTGCAKVGFVIAGTQKGGTSALDRYMRAHPEICMANRKEVHFFDCAKHFQSRPVNYRNYHLAFSPKAGHRLLGESTPIYMYWYDAPRRIWQYNPNIKAIFLLRNPIERAFSHWNMERARGLESLPFWDAIQSENLRCREALPYQHRIFSYVDRGFYSEQLRRFWTYIPKDQTLVLKTDDLKEKPTETFKRVCCFLGIELPRYVKTQTTHALPYRCSMSAEERGYLRQVFEHEIRNLERILSWDCADWLDDSSA
jgi:hypothetical protein